MIKRDYILNEVENITLIIAKLIGLQKEGDTEEFVHLYNNCLVDEYNVSLEKLYELTNEDFKLMLENENYSADKLDALAKLLYLNCEIADTNPENIFLLQKVIIIFDLLEQKYHQQSFENINKRKFIYQRLNQS